MFFSRLPLVITLIGFVVTASGQTPDALYKSGMHYKDQDKFDSAVMMFEKARAVVVPGSADEIKICSALGNIFKYVVHDFDKAEENYERALSVMQNQDSVDQWDITELYYNLATTNRSQNDYGTALSWCLKAIDGCIAMNDDSFLERTYSIAGNIYRDRHQFDSAIVYYQKGVEVNKRLNKGKDNVTLAGMYGGWGEANYKQGDPGEAERKLSYSVSVYKKNAGVDKPIFFHTVRLLAVVEIEQNKIAAAEDLLKFAEKILAQENLTKGGQVSALHKAYGDLYAAKDMMDKAVEHYDKALVAAGDLKDYAYNALLGEARVLGGTEALECYSKAEKLMIANRAELDTEDAKWNYVDANYRLYENILSTMYDLKDRDEEQLFRFMENSKSKSLSDALREAELKKAVGRNDTLLTKLQDLRQRSLSIQHQVNEKNDVASRDELLSISQKISQLEETINQKYPSYIKTRYEDNAVSLVELKDNLKKTDAVFVEYFWGDENIYSLSITGDSVKLEKVGSSPDIQKIVSQYVSYFTTKGNQYSADVVLEFSKVSHELYSLLLHRYPNRRLVIVPDGPLMQLPFETLVTKPGGDSYNQLSYLLNDHIVSYVFSASHLLATRHAPKGKPSLLAFGFTGGANERSADASRKEIAGSETELLALSDKFPDGTFLYGAGVTEKNFKDNAAKYDLLHLAVHGSGDTGEDYSATLYFRDKDGPEDGHLYWYELYNMNLRASLAVLSSCESGIGKTYRGEGMLSMANAFTFAGCDNIVMGLWKVDDQLSVKLMDTFYSELLNGMAIDEALTMAKRTYLASADQISANPKLWGSLVAYGESPVLTADKIPTGWVVTALTVLVAGIVLLLVKTRKN